MKCPYCGTSNTAESKFCKECASPLTIHGTPEISVTRTIETGIEELTRGTTFAGRYEIVEELGAGGMGRVYRAFDKKLQEDVALKLIRPDVAANRKTVERFHNEIKIARKIRHKNVCGMYDFHEEGRTLFLTMEFVRGEDLRSFIYRAKTLPVGTAVFIAHQVAEGLAEAHKLGIVHRDLKPGNIMIDKDGQAKIMDFGIARSLLGKGLTGEGAIVGTPEYMSPEQVEGKETDQRSDLYALGIILYEMLIGRPPFEGETPFSVATKHKTEPPPIPKKIIPQIPDELNKLILRCLEKDREKRYPTAEELAADLAAIEQALPSTDRALTQARTKVRTSREITVKLIPRKLALPIAGIALVLLAAVFWRAVFPKKALPSPPRKSNSIAFASMRNETGDPAWDFQCRRSFIDLLITKLENSGRFHIVTWERMVDVLKQTGKKEITSISDDDGFDICRREGIKYLCTSSLHKAGDSFAITLRFLDAESKDAFKSFESQGIGIQSVHESQIDKLGTDINRGFGWTPQNDLAAEPRIADLTTSSLEAHQAYLEGIDLFHNYRFNEARAAFERAVRIDPSFASAFRYLAMAAYQHGDNAAAREAAVQARRLALRATLKERVYINVSLAFIFGEKDSDYRSDLEKLIADFPEEKEAHFRLALVFQFDHGTRSRAYAEMIRVTKLDPFYAEPYNYLALWSAEDGKFEDAVRYGKKYDALLSDSANPLDTLASIYLDAGRFEDAEISWRAAIERDPSYHWIYEGLAYLAAMREDYSAAADWLARFSERRPAGGIESEMRLFGGFLNLWLGRFDRASADFARSEALAEDLNNQFHLRLAKMLRIAVQFEKGEAEKARIALQSMADSPSDPGVGSPAYVKSQLAFVLGWLDATSGRREDAAKRAEEMKSLSADPGGFSALFMSDQTALEAKVDHLLTLLEGEIGLRSKEASADEIRRSLERKPKASASLLKIVFWLQVIEFFYLPPPLYVDTLARAYVSEGRLDKAIGVYEAMVKRRPTGRDLGWIHPLAHYRLAQVCERAGRKKDAAAEYAKFLDFWKDADPGRPEVEDARKRLAGLQGR